MISIALALVLFSAGAAFGYSLKIVLLHHQFTRLRTAYKRSLIACNIDGCTNRGPHSHLN